MMKNWIHRLQVVFLLAALILTGMALMPNESQATVWSCQGVNCPDDPSGRVCGAYSDPSCSAPLACGYIVCRSQDPRYCI